ncbi:surface protease GP63, partial [Trypanosoma conorhini]
GSLTGGGSWCLDAEALKVKTQADAKLAGVCAQVLCEGGAVKVKYSGSDAYVACPEKSVIDVKSSDFEDGGKIKCPKYEEVCTIAANGSSLVIPRVEEEEEEIPPPPPAAPEQSPSKPSVPEHAPSPPSAPEHAPPEPSAHGHAPSPPSAPERSPSEPSAPERSPSKPSVPEQAPSKPSAPEQSPSKPSAHGHATPVGNDFSTAAAAVGFSHFVLLALAAAVTALPP